MEEINLDGKSYSIVGLILLSIYFFVFYIVVSTSIQISYKYDLGSENINVNDPGFYNTDYPLNVTSECSGGGTLGTIFCSHTNYVDELSCEYVPGCTWDGVNNECDGLVDTDVFNPTGALNYNCNKDINETLCKLMGCTWTIYEPTGGTTVQLAQTDPYSWSQVWKTLSFMTSFDADIGLGGWKYGFILAFFIFWIPLLLYILCIYMLVPFLH